MPDFARTLSINMRTLVACIGCQDAAAAAINIRWDANTSKSIISRKLSGSLSWGLLEVMALEDAVGKHPVTDMMHGRLDVESTSACSSLVEQSGIIAKESGEAIAAILAAQQSSNGDDATQAVVEIDEAVQALLLARARLQIGSAK